MDIFVSSNGAQRGPFSLEQVQQMRGRGEISAAAFVWYQGLPAWIPATQLQADGSVAPPPLNQTASFKHGAAVAFDRVTGRISSAAGVEKLQDWSSKDFFSQILSKRTDEDIEELFNGGTRTSTPPLAMVNANWPKPWVFFRAIVAALLLFGGFYYGAVHFRNANFIPGLVLVGSFGIPLATLIFFVEMNVARNISLYQIFKLVNAGGLGAMIITVFLATLWTTENALLGSFSTGFIEEAAKLLTVVLFMRKKPLPWTLNGLLMGAAVGAGFAAFESAGYALRYADDLMGVIFVRAMLAPAGHVVWTALATAALWKVKQNQPLTAKMFGDARFLRVFGLVVICHALWDLSLFNSAAFSYVKYATLGFVAWVVVLAYVQDGLKQIREAQGSRSRTEIEPEAIRV